MDDSNETAAPRRGVVDAAQDYVARALLVLFVIGCGWMAFRVLIGDYYYLTDQNTLCARIALGAVLRSVTRQKVLHLRLRLRLRDDCTISANNIRHRLS